MNPRPNEYAYFLPIVMPLVQPCPKYLVMDAIRHAAVDFFTRTRVWRERHVGALTEGANDIPLPPASSLVRVEYVGVNGQRLILGIDYVVRDATVDVKFPKGVEGPCCTELCVSLCPSRMPRHCPTEQARDWGDAVVYGALAKIKAMSGNSVGWIDAEGAKVHFDLYESEIARAQRLVTRDRAGWNILTVAS